MSGQCAASAGEEADRDRDLKEKWIATTYISCVSTGSHIFKELVSYYSNFKLKRGIVNSLLHV